MLSIVLLLYDDKLAPQIQQRNRIGMLFGKLDQDGLLTMLVDPNCPRLSMTQYQNSCNTWCLKCGNWQIIIECTLLLY